MNTSSADFDALEREIVDHLFEIQPGGAVALGLHDYDGRSPDLSREATDRWIAAADRLLGRVEAVDPGTLSPDRAYDRFLLRLLLESPLFDLRDAQELERNPVSYVGMFTFTPYLARDYAPAAARAGSIARILREAPGLLATGRRRLNGPLPKAFVDLGLAIGGQLPAHFAEAEAFATNAGVGDQVASARAVAEPALLEFLAWLKDDELPRATPDFALGPARFQKLLFVREGIEAPLREIRDAGAADLHRNQSRLAEIAREAGESVPQLFSAMSADHPAAKEVLGTARAFVDETRAFVVAQRLATIPEPSDCRVEETPPYARAWTTASMSAPGPFETASPEGIYFVTLVDPTWTPEQQSEWLRALNRPMLRNITVHEVYPGHYLQLLHHRERPGSLARKVYYSPSFVEGWAHYAEQLAIEAGLQDRRRDAEVAQIHDALLRNCRLLSSIGLHTEGWPVERSTELFRREAHMEQLPAEREALRGTFDPGYFCYTLGKLAILDARKKLLVPTFGGSLHDFHDAVLGFGSPPVGLIERLLERSSTAS